MIKSFACTATEAIFHDQQTPELPPTIQATARRKLVQINLAQQLTDLRVPPGNRLEALKGNRTGRHSFASTINGAFVSDGQRAASKRLKS
jgi:proteic killer suppression protein